MGKLLFKHWEWKGKLRKTSVAFVPKNNMVTFKEDFLGKEKAGDW